MAIKEGSQNALRFSYEGSGRKNSRWFLFYQLSVICAFIILTIAMPFLSKYPVWEGELVTWLLIFMLTFFVYVNQTIMSDVEVDEHGIRRYWLNLLWQERRWEELMAIEVDSCPIYGSKYNTIATTLIYELRCTKKRRPQILPKGPVRFMGNLPGAEQLCRFIEEHLSKRNVTIINSEDPKRPIILDRLPMPPPLPDNY